VISLQAFDKTWETWNYKCKRWCHCFSLQSDISNYWPGMHNTAFLFVFADLCDVCG